MNHLASKISLKTAMRIAHSRPHSICTRNILLTCITIARTDDFVSKGYSLHRNTFEQENSWIADNIIEFLLSRKSTAWVALNSKLPEDVAFTIKHMAGLSLATYGHPGKKILSLGQNLEKKFQSLDESSGKYYMAVMVIRIMVSDWSNIHEIIDMNEKCPGWYAKKENDISMGEAYASWDSAKSFNCSGDTCDDMFDLSQY